MTKVTSIAGKLRKKDPGQELQKTLQKEDDAKFPSDLASCIALVFKSRAKRKKLEAEVEKERASQHAIEEYIIRTFEKDKIEGVKCKYGTVTLAEKDIPKATDWDAIYEYVKKHGAWDLLQRRLGEKACQARWEANEAIPGVEKYHDKRLSLSEKK